MWKNICFQIFVIAITASNAADLYCQTPIVGGKCIVQNMTSATSANEVINVVGQASNFVDTVTISLTLDQNIQTTYFPTGILKVFTALDSFNLYNNGITQLVTDSVNYCSNLKSLLIQYQNFTNVPAGFAQNCVELTGFSLAFNGIITLDPNALKGLSKVFYADLSYNTITCIPPGLFSPLVSVGHLMLNYNKIIAIDSKIIVGLPKISEFGLGGNNLEYIPILDLTGTGTSSNNNLGIFLVKNPIKALNQTLFSSYYPTLQNLFFTIGGLAGTNICLSAEMTIDSSNWNTITTNAALAACYNNWTPEMSSNVIPCGVTTTTSTTTTTTVATTNAPGGGTTKSPSQCCQEPVQPCCQYGVLRVILQAFRNMTFSAGFASA